MTNLSRLKPRHSMTTAVLVFLAQTSSAAAAPIDCAILLCMAGGFPPSTECAAAKAEMIRRITPVPVEPPLQIWRCPMQSASLDGNFNNTPIARLYKAAASHSISVSPAVSISAQFPTTTDIPAVDALGEVMGLRHLVQSEPEINGKADIDISGPEFDFVRSIKVWHVWQYFHRPAGESENCKKLSVINLGTYDDQGQYIWSFVDQPGVPSWVGLNPDCGRNNHVSNRIGFEWTDYEGNHSYQVVDY